MSLLDEMRAAGIKPANAPQNNTEVASPSTQKTLLQQMQEAGIKPANPPRTSDIKRPPQQGSFLQKTGDFLFKDIPTGIVKGAASTIKGAANLGGKIFDPIDKLIPGIDTTNAPDKLQSVAEDKLNVPQGTLLKPSNIGQKIGFGGEQVAEFFIPGGVAAKAGKAVETAKFLEAAPKVIQKAVPLLTKMGTEGLVSAGQTALQEGDINGKSAVAFATGAIAPVVSGVLSKTSKTIPENMWSKVLNRTAKQVEKNPNLEKEIATFGIMGPKKKIAEIAKNKLQNAELQLDDLIKNTTETIDGKAVAPYLDEIKKSYANIPGEENSVKVIQSLQDEIAARGQLTAPEAQNLKKDIYGLISKSYGKGTLEVTAKTEAQKQMARGLKEEIEKIVPEAKTLNQKISIFSQVRKSIEKQLMKPRGGISGTGIGVYDLTLGGLGTVAAGGSTGVGLVVARKVADSTIVRTGISKIFNYFNQLSPTQKALFYNALKGSLVYGSKQQLSEEQK